MQNSITEGDILVARKFRRKNFKPTFLANEMIIIKPRRKNLTFVKRCVGLPGDTIFIDNSYIVTTNSSQEPYNSNVKTFSNLGDDCKMVRSHTYGPIVIPSADVAIQIDSLNVAYYKSIINTECRTNFSKQEITGRSYIFRNDYYFVLGDNRANSIDSRDFGFIESNEIIGKIVSILAFGKGD